MNPYLQFELGCLAFGSDDRERINSIIGYSVLQAGRALIEEDSSSILAEIEPPPDFDEENQDHMQAVIGAHHTGVKLPTVTTAIRQWQAVRKFIDGFTANYGPDALVRLRTDLVFDARNGANLTPRELYVFAAIISSIGRRNLAWVTRSTIQHRMLGYKTKAIMQAELPSRRDGSEPLTMRQIGYDLDKLHCAQFFARARKNERQTFYSIRMPQADLETSLASSKGYAEDFHQRRRERDAARFAARKAADNRIKADELPPVKANEAIKADIDSGVHEVSAGVSASLSTGVSTIIKTPNRNPNENSLTGAIPVSETIVSKPEHSPKSSSNPDQEHVPVDIDRLRRELREAAGMPPKEPA